MGEPRKIATEQNMPFTFFELLHTFSRTMLIIGGGMGQTAEEDFVPGGTGHYTQHSENSRGSTYYIFVGRLLKAGI